MGLLHWPAQIADADALRAACTHPRGRGDGTRAAAELAADSGLREARHRIQPGQPEVSSGAVAPRACRLRVGLLEVAARRSWI
jgi:hypothetical protein